VERIVGLVGAGTVQLGPVIHLLPEPSADPSQIDLLWRAVANMRERAREGPVLLGIDDVQELDEASATLVHHLVRSGTVQTIMTLELGAAIPLPISALIEEKPEVLILERLERSAARALADGGLGAPLGDREFETLWSVSHGLPLIIHEVLEGARESGLLVETSGRWFAQGSLVANDRLTSIVERRLASLGSAERYALELIALAQPIDLGCVQALVEPGALERLEAGNLIDVQCGGHRLTARVAHQLHREVLRSGLPPIRSRRMWKDLADVLGRQGMRRLDDAVRSSIWQLNAGERPPSVTLVEAANQAIALFDPQLGEQLARAALPHASPFGPLLALAQSLAGQRRFNEADKTFRELLAATSTTEDRVNGAIAFGFYLSWHRQDAQEALRVLEATEDDVQGEPRQLLAAYRANVLLALNRLHDALRTAETVLQVPGISERTRLLALNTSATAAALMGKCDRALADVESGEPLVMSLADEDAGRLAMFSLPCASFLAHLHRGNTEEAGRIAEEHYEFATAVGARVLVAGWRMLGSEVEIMRGRPARAVLHLRESIEILRDADAFHHLPLALSFLVRAAVSCGDRETATLAAGEIDTLRRAPTLDAVIEPAYAWVAASEGRMDVAVRSLLASAAKAEAAGQWVMLARILHTVARFGVPSQVVERLEALAEKVDGALTGLMFEHARAHATGDPFILEQVAEKFFPIDVIVAAETTAAASVQFARRGDQVRSLRASIRTVAMLSGTEGATSPTLERLRARASLSDLTRREADVAVLAGRGQSNREIANALHVSVRTVENHLYRIYAKLQVTGREELAARLVAPSGGG
jgi:DNA-binding CsgD family transcriptional regulator